MQMKSEDSILLMNVRGEPITLNKRKDEATDLICNVMGVSKAVINYVLFCHQEESDWPLWSDMEVMNRFDKIFGTTEYNNAVDKMRKTKKELENDVKDKSKFIQVFIESVAFSLNLHFHCQFQRLDWKSWKWSKSRSTRRKSSWTITSDNWPESLKSRKYARERLSRCREKWTAFWRLNKIWAN